MSQHGAIRLADAICSAESVAEEKGGRGLCERERERERERGVLLRACLCKWMCARLFLCFWILSEFFGLACLCVTVCCVLR